MRGCHARHCRALLNPRAPAAVSAADAGPARRREHRIGAGAVGVPKQDASLARPGARCAIQQLAPVCWDGWEILRPAGRNAQAARGMRR
jgi:hypothetical protein